MYPQLETESSGNQGSNYACASLTEKYAPMSVMPVCFTQVLSISLTLVLPRHIERQPPAGKALRHGCDQPPHSFEFLAASSSQFTNHTTPLLKVNYS